MLAQVRKYDCIALVLQGGGALGAYQCGVAEALDGRRSAGPAMVDSAVLALSLALLAVPGLVSTVAGMILLSRPGRALARPAVGAFGARQIATLVDESTLVTVLSRPGFGTVVEGQVVDGNTEQSPRQHPDHPPLPPGLAH